MPATLAELVRLRIGRLEGDVRDVLLAAACVAAPTVDLLAQATDTTAERVVDLLEDAETDGIVGIDGNRVRFSHPLLARGVYTDASPARRRAMHRALAAVEALPELKARHLALATASTDRRRWTLWTPPPTRRGPAVRRLPPPNYWAWRSGSAVTRRGAGSARPQHHFQAGDTELPAACSNPSSSSEPGSCERSQRIMLAGNPHLRQQLREAAELLEPCAQRRRRYPTCWCRCCSRCRSLKSMGIGQYDEAAPTRARRSPLRTNSVIPP